MGKDNLDTWDNFISNNFLKVIDVKSDNHPFICIGVEEIQTEGKKSSTPRINLESDQENYDYDLNKTNITFIRNAGFKSPRSLIGKKIFFTKARAINPKLKQEVDTLRICKIENLQ